MENIFPSLPLSSPDCLSNYISTKHFLQNHYILENSYYADTVQIIPLFAAVCPEQFLIKVQPFPISLQLLTVAKWCTFKRTYNPGENSLKRLERHEGVCRLRLPAAAVSNNTKKEIL